MKASILISCWALVCVMPIRAQSADPAQQVIDGGRLIVDLIAALGAKPGPGRDPGCKNRHADLCVENAAGSPVSVVLEYRATGQRRDIVIQPGGKECALQLEVGVWTYDLRPSGAATAMRKGDIRVEGCQDLLMQIR